MLSLGCAHSGRRPGLEVVKTDAGSIQYLHHQPTSITTERVILAHGFLRTPDTMEHLATAWSGQGIETVSIALRHSRPWSGNHLQNPLDIIALRKALGWKSATYAGFSAGGLSALLAAAEDPACTKLLLLDPVDHGALGVDASRSVHIPTLAILGRPGSGNGNRNAAGMLELIPRCRIEELADATHCDFEARPSALCYRFTGSKADTARIPGIHSALIRYSTRFLTAGPGKG